MLLVINLKTKVMEKESIYCPFCLTELVVTHQDNYEDLSDHVSNPNGIPSLKDGYQCPNKACVVQRIDAAWIYDGDWYYTRPDDMTYAEVQDMKKLSTTGMTYAVNSWNHYYNQGLDEIKKHKRKFKLGKNWKLDIEPKMKGWKYPIEKQYMPDFWRWKLQWWKREEKGKDSFVGVTPTLHMVIFCVKQFKDYHKSAMKNRVKHDIDRAFDEAFGLRWGTKDDRTFVKISSFIIRWLYPKQVDDIIKLKIEKEK